MENNERTLPELKARLEKTINILEKVRVEEMAGMEGKEVVLRPYVFFLFLFCLT